MNEMKEAHVYSMNDCDWVAAFSLESAVAWYKHEIGGSTGDEVLDDPSELDDAEMASLKFRHDRDGDPEGPTISFRARLAELAAEAQEFPCFFASTEY